MGKPQRKASEWKLLLEGFRRRASVLSPAGRGPHQGQEKHVLLWNPEVAAWGKP